MKSIGLLSLVLFTSLAWAQLDPNETLRFRDQTFEVANFSGGGTLNFGVNPETNELYWMRDGKLSSEMVSLPYDGVTWNQAKAEFLQNFGTSYFTRPRYIESTKDMLYVSDEGGNETYNIYQYDTQKKTMDQLTRLGWAYGFDVDPEAGQLFVIGKKGKTELESCLYTRAYPDGPADLKVLRCDDQRYRFWAFEHPYLDPSGKWAAVRIQKDGLRSKSNLGLIHTHTGDQRVVTDPRLDRANVAPLGWWGDSFYFIADGVGDAKNSLYAYDLRTEKLTVAYSTQLPRLDGYLHRKLGKVFLFAANVEGSKFVLFDAQAQETTLSLDSKTYPHVEFWRGFVQPNGDGKLVAYAYSAEKQTKVLLSLDLHAAGPDAFLREVFVLEKDLRIKQSCDFEIVSYPTFDPGPDGKPRMIEAVLYKPKSTVKVIGGMVFAHGGPSGQSTKILEGFHRAMCEIGVVTMGANVRGSTGYGQAFEKLNDRDWGGGDYLDYVHSATYLRERFKITPEHLGIYGHSYGGYMVNWALTRTQHPFAYGISSCGISDLTVMLKESTIPDMMIDELGNPDTSAEIRQLYVDRSPLTWASNLKRPLLVLHGAQDNRVPLKNSRLFVEAIRAAHGPVTYFELPGDAHGYKFRDNLVKYYQEIFDLVGRNSLR